MFTKIAIIVLIATAFVMLVHLVVTRSRRNRAAGPVRANWRPMELLVYAALIGTTVVLGFSSIYGVMAEGVMMGWMLWLHTAAAGAFVVALALAAVLWAEASRFRLEAVAASTGRRPRFSFLSRVCYWVVLSAGAVSTATILVNMFSLVGTQGQHELIEIHRYSGLALLAAAVLHLYSVSVARWAAA